MSAAGKTSSIIVKRYTSAFVDLAIESKILPKVKKDIAALGQAFEEAKDLQMVFALPTTQKTDLHNVITDLAKKLKLQEITKNFLSVLVENGRISYIQKILQEFDEEVAYRDGEMKIKVQVAQDLTAKQRKELEASLAKAIGAKKVTVDIKIEPDLIGGLVVTVGSTMVDDSVRSKLERLRVAMNKRSNENDIENLSEVG